jgi:hypothetical protein
VSETGQRKTPEFDRRAIVVPGFSR